LNIFSNEKNIKQAKESSGRSGSFFFFSYDKRFILKTINLNELKTLLELLPSLYNYLCYENSMSLLSRIYGAFSINIGGISQINLILMENSLAENNDVKIFIISNFCLC
jgi:1-phosphatidylinositol-4-phosphate 5-kinase